MKRERMFTIAPFVIGEKKSLEIEQAESAELSQRSNAEESGKMFRPFTIGKTAKQLGKIEAYEAYTMSDAEKVASSAKVIKKTGEAPVSNFRIIPLMRIVYVDRKSCEKKELEKIRTRVEIMGESSHEIDIPLAEIRNLATYISRRFSTAIINFSEPQAEKKIEVDYRMRTRGILTLTCYMEAGWQNIDGKHMYLYDSVDLGKECVVSTKKDLPVDMANYADVGSILKAALSLYMEGIAMSTMFLYSLTGVMYRLFAEAGFPPHFLLFLNGKTGAMKTTLAKILFIQLCNDKHRDHVRSITSDTVNSFERAVVESGVDTVTVIDDYCPAKTASDKRNMASKLESVVRMVGDGSSKSRSNAHLDDIQGEGVQGTVVLTGEIRGKGLSSNLRCMYCEIERGKVNVDVVTWFQENPRAYTTLIGVFVIFLSHNWDEVVVYIKTYFTAKRKEIGKEIEEKRVVDSVVTLQIIAEIVERFCVDYCRFEKEVAFEMTQKMKNDVMFAGKYSQSISEKESPAGIFVRAIRDLILMKTITTCEKSIFSVGKGWDGFEDSDYVYLVPERTYAKVRDFLGRTGYFFPMDLSEIVVMLHEEHLVKTHRNGVGKKVYYARVPFEGKKHKFLQIPKKVFEEIADEKF